MSAASDDSIENIDFGGRLASQFYNNNCSNLESDANNLLILNPTTSTPVASDNSICDSGYESFGQAHRKSSSSPNTTNSNNNHSITTSTTTNINTSVSSNSNINRADDDDDINNHNTSNFFHGSTDINNNNVNNSNNLVGCQQQSTHSIRQTSSVATSSASPSGNNSKSSLNANNAHLPITNQSLSSTRSNNLSSNSNKCCSKPPSHTVSAGPLTADELAKLSAGIGLMKLIMTPEVVRQQRSNSLFATSPAVANNFGTANPWATQDVYQRFTNVDAIERAASLHRTAASYSEPQYTWSGQLPSRTYKNPVFSCKVFLGGVPWDVTEQGLIETFGRFGPLRVQWPGKDVRQPPGQTKAGYVYLVYESERYVKALLQACTQDFGAGSHPEKYYYRLSSRRMRSKEVQVIPWVLADSNYLRNQSGRPDLHRTVFVGALHGMLTAEGLAKIMNDLFGGVAYVGIDSDKYKYPLGSGRVTFISQRSYMKAVSAAFVEVKSSQFCKKIQVDPYLEPSGCSTCHIHSGPIFCRDCLRYFCKTCWNWHHSAESIIGRQQHRPLMRKKRET